MQRHPSHAGQPTSWAATKSVVRAYQHRAQHLVGRTVVKVRYYEIDYRQQELYPELVGSGLREIGHGPEWNEPPWAASSFDSVDFGIELTLDDANVVSLTWETPSEHEGLCLVPTPMLHVGMRPATDMAVWNITHATAWEPMISEPLTRVDLHYIPWDERGTGFWCPRVTLQSQSAIEIILGDAHNGVLVPSADNLAVLHPGTPLPDWVTAPASV